MRKRGEEGRSKEYIIGKRLYGRGEKGRSKGEYIRMKRLDEKKGERRKECTSCGKD
jgi:hypothetical protein